MTATPLSARSDQPRGRHLRRILGAVALVIVGWLLLTQVIFTGGDSDQSAKVRSSSGASWCRESSYQLVNHLDGSKATVYDCGFPHGRERCVTMSGGVTRDSTEEVRLLFAGTLGAEKPGCVG